MRGEGGGSTGGESREEGNEKEPEKTEKNGESSKRMNEKRRERGKEEVLSNHWSGNEIRPLTCSFTVCVYIISYRIPYGW